MEYKSEILHFEGFCIDIRKDNMRKIKSVPRFLKVKVLTLCINNMVQMFHIQRNLYSKIIKFKTSEELSLNDFSEIIFKISEGVSEYYKKKMHTS